MQRIDLFRAKPVIFIATAPLFAAFTFWLVDSPIKYALFGTEIAITFAVFFLLHNRDAGSFQNIGFETFVRKRRVPELTLIVGSLFLQLAFIEHLSLNGFQLAISLICGSFIAGHLLLRLFTIERYVTRLENILLSFLASFILTGITTMLFIWVNEALRPLIILGIFVAIGFASLLRRSNYANSTRSLSKNIDIIALCLPIAFYIIFFVNIYPEFNLIPTSDVSRHYAYSTILSRTPDLYTQFSYVLFHSFEATLNSISGLQNAEDFLTAFATLNLFFPIAVYALAKRYLETLDKRIPALATIVYTLFSNFSFIYFAYLQLGGNGATTVQMLNQTGEKALNGSIYFVQPFPFLVPLSISIIMYMAGFLLLRERQMPRHLFVPLFTAIVVAMVLTHASEAVIFAGLLIVFAMISNNNKSFRLNDALLSLAAAFGIATFFELIIFVAWPRGLRIPGIDYFQVGLPMGVALLSLLVWKMRASLAKGLHTRENYTSGLPKLPQPTRLFRPSAMSILRIALVAAYGFSMMAWFFGDFKTSTVSETGQVPWFLYPIVLGVPGLLVILGLKDREILANPSVRLMVTGIVVLLVTGRILSFLNINFFVTGYWEKRFLVELFIFISLLAPIALIRFADSIRNRKLLVREAVLMTVVSTIVFFGFSSMELQSEYWSLVTGPNTISNTELNAINQLKQILQKDPRSYVVTPTTYSQSVVMLSAPAYVPAGSNLLFASTHPDIPLFELSRTDLNHAYLYLNQRDLNYLNQKPDSWFVKYLLPELPILYSNAESKIYNVSRGSFPLPESGTNLVESTDPTVATSSAPILALLSHRNIEFSIKQDLNPSALSGDTTILGFDPSSDRSLHYDFSNLRDWTVVSGQFQPSGSGLMAGDQSNNPSAVILSHVYSKEPNVSTVFSTQSLDPQVASYVSIIHHWIDAKNYGYAGVTLLNSKIYVSNTKVTNGVTSVDPPWPGLVTEVKWTTGANYNLTLSTHNSTTSLYLNGKNYLSFGDDETQGTIGLGYGRLQNVKFSYFDATINEMTGRPLHDYLNYANSGGNLIVLNADGYGDIAKTFFTISENNIEPKSIDLVSALGISNSSRSQIPTSIHIIDFPANSTLTIGQAKVLNLIPNNAVPLAVYSYGSKQSIFAASMRVGGGEITYVDIYPLIPLIAGNDLSQAKIQGLLDFIVGRLNVLSLTTPPVLPSDVKASFQSVSANGIIVLNSTSILFPHDREYDAIGVSNKYYGYAVLHHVRDLTISDLTPMLIHADTVRSTDGIGGYSNMTFGRDLVMELKNGRVDAVADGKAVTLRNVTAARVIDNQSISVYAKDPTAQISGASVFADLNSAKLYRATGVAGQNLTVNGETRFKIFMADKYSLATDIDVKGIAKRSPPMDKYDEWNGIYKASFTDLFTLPQPIRMMLIFPAALSVLFLSISWRRSIIRSPS